MGRSARVVLAAFVLVAAVEVLVDLPGGPAAVVQNALGSDCTVGLAGAAVSIEIQGGGADGVCRSYAGQVTDGGSWYVYQAGARPGGAVICQVALASLLYTVRDNGSLNLYGTSVCKNLIAAANPTLPPAPPAASVGPMNSDGTVPFSPDPSSSQSLNYQEHQYLYSFIKPCPRAGCENASPDPRWDWMRDWEASIPPVFLPCLDDPMSGTCQQAIQGP